MKTENKVIKFLNQHSDLIGWILLACLFISMNVEIYFKLDQTMESDFASELVLAKLLANEKRLISTNWFYSTELRVVNSNLVSMPLFLFLDNWHTVRILTIAIMEIILFFGFFYLAKQLEIKHIPWIALLVIGATSNEYYKFVLLCSSYIPHIVLAFVSFGLIINIFKVNKKKNTIIKLSILLLLAYIGALESVRLMSITYIPLVATSILYCFIKQLNNLKNGSFNFKDKTVQLIIISVLGFISSFAGTVTNIFILPKFGYSYKLDTARIYYTDMDFSKLGEVLSGWLKVFGYQSNELEVLTFWQIIIKPLFVIMLVVIIWSIVDIIRNNDNKYNEYEYFIALFMVVGASILTLLFIFTSTWYRNRYLLPVSVFSVFTIAIFISHYRINWQSWAMIILLSLYIFVNTHYQINYQIQYDGYGEFVEIKDILLENDCYNGYCDWHWNGHNLLTELSDGEIETWVFAIDYDAKNEWLQAKDHLTREPQGKTFLLTENMIFSYDIKPGCEAHKYYQDSERTLYIFDSVEQMKELITNIGYKG